MSFILNTFCRFHKYYTEPLKWRSSAGFRVNINLKAFIFFLMIPNGFLYCSCSSEADWWVEAAAGSAEEGACWEHAAGGSDPGGNQSGVLTALPRDADRLHVRHSPCFLWSCAASGSDWVQSSSFHCPLCTVHNSSCNS